MRSGVTGNTTVNSLQISVRRGYSHQDGVTADTHSATYFWSPVVIVIYSTINFTRLSVTTEVDALYGRLIFGWLGVVVARIADLNWKL